MCLDRSRVLDFPSPDKHAAKAMAGALDASSNSFSPVGSSAALAICELPKKAISP
jgi:hypothetical protein